MIRTRRKKNKKRKTSPQRSINRIWRHFAAKKFTKVLAILPFDPVPQSTITEQPSELLTAGYERAANKCRLEMKKILQECRRINQRYRNPNWDIDWDLRMGKGDCLNYLGSNKFDLSTVHTSSTTSMPKAVKRMHEIFDKPTFMKHINSSDVKQGMIGDCWFIASLSALANVGRESPGNEPREARGYSSDGNTLPRYW
ncbi:hypothetical protein BX600DRAFT_384997 [Xylariales sp. PMI_506]|nr:hypothetical protein BX600DRAFT_384997 [Xylariales sp. PMI_506]